MQSLEQMDLCKINQGLSFHICKTVIIMLLSFPGYRICMPCEWLIFCPIKIMLTPCVIGLEQSLKDFIFNLLEMSA